MSEPDEFAADVDVERTPEPVAESGQDEEQPFESVQEKTSSGLFLKAMIVLIALGGIGFYFLRSPTAPVAVHLGPAVSPALPQEKNIMAMPDASALKMVAPPTSPAPAPIASPPLPAAAPAAAPTPAAAPVEAKPEEAVPIEAMQVPPAQALPAPIASPPLPAAAPVLPVEKSTVEKSTMEKGAVEKITAAEMMMPSPPVKAAPAAGNADAIAAQAKIKALEKQVADLEKTIQDMQSSVGKTEEAADENAAAPARTVKKSARKGVRRIHLRRPRQAQASPARSEWVLKAAKPGTAWVALRGSAELRAVVPGDSLPGLGRVLSVMKDSFGHWTLNGTQGRISN